MTLRGAKNEKSRIVQRATVGATTRLHAGSLLHIPLVRHMLTDSSIRLVPRAIDSTWAWMKVVPAAIGFRPFYSEIMYPAAGLLAKWLKSPAVDARPFNPDDKLVEAVLFMVHDYLHAWSYGHVREGGGPIVAGYSQVTEKNVEDHVFVHLLTEACATVGLDYWYLGTTRLGSVCDIGTGLRGLTTAFHEDAMGEYRRFNPGLEVQTPAFLVRLVEFYCSGVFHGFGRAALTHSPVTARWLRHELTYGEKQRIYTRQWLRHLGGLPSKPDDELRRPVSCGAPWKQRLMRAMAERLFAKVKTDVVDQPRPAPRGGRWRSSSAAADFRFTNVNAMDEAEIERAVAKGLDKQQFRCFAAQFVARHRLAAFDPSKHPILHLALTEAAAPALVAAMKGASALPPASEPRDVFFLA